MRILLSAYACHPDRGSEPGIGWNWLKELSRENEVWAFIYAGQGQKEAVQKAVVELPYRQNIRIIPITVPRFFHDRLYRIRYEIWQWRAYKVAKSLLQKVKIDLIHHVTIATWWNCGHLWKLNVPFIFGPISGAQQAPRATYPFLRFRDRVYEWIRTLLFKLSWRMWRRPRRAIKEARLVLVTNAETGKKVKKIRKDTPTILFSAVGVRRVIDEDTKTHVGKATKSINLLWSGRLIPCKNFRLLLESLSELPANINWSLRVAGGGRLFDYWKKKIKQRGLQNQISFLGKIDFSQMGEQYQWADVFVFPSLREGTATVMVEAMSYGLPVIALNMHGATIVLDDSCAIRIPVASKEQMIRDFRDAIIKLYNGPELRRKMGEVGRRRVEENYLWEKRAKKINKIYREIVCGEAKNENRICH